MRACTNCGGRMIPAKRYEATRTVDVRLCLECGEETPPLYRRSASIRNGTGSVVDAACETCGTAIYQRLAGWPKYCGLACRPKPVPPHVRRMAS